MYLAEVPALQGCMAWGDTPEQTLDELRHRLGFSTQDARSKLKHIYPIELN